MKPTLSVILLIALLVFAYPENRVMAQGPVYQVSSDNLTATVTSQGIQSITIGSGKLNYPVEAITQLEGCKTVGRIGTKALPGGGIELTRNLIREKTKERCTLVERFLPAGETIRWEIEIRGAGEPWTTQIQSGIRWPATEESRFWAPYFRYEEPHVLYIPFQWGLICIPMVSVIERHSDIGLSLVLDPNDEILDLTLTTSDDGTLTFNRIYNRISADRTLHFSMNLVAFTTNWQASFDFPFMGMFLPPVGENEKWIRFGGDTTSIAGMREYARKMKEMGFYVLNYFNVTEFGTRMDWLRMYNENRDDGITWFIDRPARSLITSWKFLMNELAPIMHDAGAPLNTTALMAAMRGKKWVLEPHCLDVDNGAAKANLFEVPGGYVIPVASFFNGVLKIKVPLIRGCAMVRITRLISDPPKPYGPLPSAAQLKWHQSELYGLVHFSTTTYANLEWGYGDEPASDFNPKEFNADQIAAAAKAGGLKGLILVTKHHCGFCLWPSKYNDSYSVKNSPWKDSKGDMVKEYADACRKYGLKFGVYLSPWDRNNKDYGRPEYITYYLNQLRELLTNYGPIYEVWLDGANGGDGWYGGAKEKRTIDKNSYYPFDKIFALVRELQPNAAIFSDIGPDARWVGNESGMANDTCWATFTPKNRDDERLPVVPGNTKYQEGESGHRDGKYWIPAESDFPLRNGWFYHPKEHPKTPENLWKVYLESVGRGTSMNIGLAPDTRGLLCDEDVKALEGFGRILSGSFRSNLAAKAKITAGNIRNNNPSFGTAHLTDSNPNTYWATDDAITNCGVVFEYPDPITFDIIRFGEYLPLGQRVEGWEIDTWTGTGWKEMAKGASIGSCRIVQTEPVNTTKVRFRITKSPVCPAISDFGLYLKSSGIDPDPQAEEEIMTSMRQSQDYWNAGNLEGFMHNYWHSDSLKFIGKTGITYGWDATLKRYKASYPDKSKQGTLKFDFIHLEKISPDAWFQVGKYTLVRGKETLSGHFTLLWRKINGEWRIVADHSS
ncbi:MAG: alpha-L-fucosidase [Bacteroidales bacterium]